MQGVSDSIYSLVASRSCKKERRQQGCGHTQAHAENEHNEDRKRNCTRHRVLLRINDFDRFGRSSLWLCWRSTHLWWRYYGACLTISGANNAARHNVTFVACVKMTIEKPQHCFRLLLWRDVNQKICHILRIHRTGLLCHTCSQVCKANNCNPIVGCVNFILLCKLTVTSTDSGQVNDHTTRLHNSHGIFRNEFRRWPSRNRSRCNCNVCLHQDFLERFLLCLLELVRAFFGISTLSRSIFLEVDFHPFGAHRCHLIRNVAHIPSTYYRTQSLGSADRCKTCNSAAKNEGI
mmetsp:Transcript_594/g.985  ORF Transcript_594/g.985 Transcript_594/m.985 type:complete len:291 (-) Transcript_594:649-1521(-)